VIRDDWPSVACRGGPARRYEQLRAELSSTIEFIGSSDQGGLAEFFELLGPDHFVPYLAELTEALETGSGPGGFWAKWINVVVERTPSEADEPEKAP
jgi:hypothetical protein